MSSYSNSIKIPSFCFRRAPHLPSPEVCDWLLAQKWSEPGRVNYQSTDSSGCIEECSHSYAGIGANEMIDLFLPAGALEILREDAKARAALGWIGSQIESIKG